MTTHRFHIAILTAFGLTAACSESDGPSGDVASTGGTGAGSGGASNAASGGSGSANGGSGNGGQASASAAGGSSGGSGGGSGSAGEVGELAGRDCTASSTALAPAGGAIADFEPDAGADLGQVVAFAVGGPSAPTFSTAGGALHISADIAPTSMPQAPNVLFGFEGCVDASSFSGVQFSISGTVSGCTLRYASSDVAHQDRNSGAPHATGPAGSYQPQATIGAAQLTSTPQTLMMPFVGGPSGGNPATPIDPAKLIFLLWQLDIAAASAGAPSCTAELDIDDVRFY